MELLEAREYSILDHEVENLVRVRNVLKALQFQNIHMTMTQLGHNAVDRLHVVGIAAKVGWVVGHNDGVVDSGVELLKCVRSHGRGIVKEDQLSDGEVA